MKNIILVSIALFTLSVPAIGAATTTWQGVISDSMCGADHSMMASGGKVDPRECTQACVKGGSKYVFVSGGKVYNIENQNLAALKEHAGHSMNITGLASKDGKTINISKIDMPSKAK